MSLPNFNKFETYQRNGFARRFTFTINGVVQDITGYDIKFIVKVNDTDEDVVFVKQLVLTSPLDGIADLVLTRQDTNIAIGTYVAAVEIRATHGGEPVSIRGLFCVYQNVLENQ